MDTRLKEIVKRIAKEEGKSPAVIEAVLRNTTDWLRENMKELNYPGYRWPRFGTFNLLENKIYYARSTKTTKSNIAQLTEGDVEQRSSDLEK